MGFGCCYFVCVLFCLCVVVVFVLFCCCFCVCVFLFVKQYNLNYPHPHPDNNAVSRQEYRLVVFGILFEFGGKLPNNNGDSLILNCSNVAHILYSGENEMLHNTKR